MGIEMKTGMDVIAMLLLILVAGLIIVYMASGSESGLGKIFGILG